MPRLLRNSQPCRQLDEIALGFVRGADGGHIAGKLLRNFDAIIFRALNGRGQLAGMFNEAGHLAGGKIILAALE